ncbi:MAG: DUF1499 domain-containing protein [Ahrensia sp.]|nr:DUF1499 domain-containing protein [Ahrensia sp.]
MTSIANRLERLERHPSRAAWWCQKLALFCLPFLAMVVIGHKIGAIDTIPTFWMLGLGFVLLMTSLIAGGQAFYELWTYGHQGGLKASAGVMLSLVLLTPYLWVAFNVYRLPQLHDISTDLVQPPSFENALEDRTSQMNAIREPSPQDAKRQLAAYPRVSARRYPLGAGRVFKTAAELIADRGWTILTTETEQGEARIDEEGSGLVAEPTVTSDGRPINIPIPLSRPIILENAPDEAPSQEFEAQQVSPVGRDANLEAAELDERYIEAVAFSFVFGFESDVVLRLIEEDEGTLVDMRSVSRFGQHDLGANARLVEGFMADLDDALQGLNQGR